MNLCSFPEVRVFLCRRNKFFHSRRPERAWPPTLIENPRAFQFPPTTLRGRPFCLSPRHFHGLYKVGIYAARAGCKSESENCAGERRRLGYHIILLCRLKARGGDLFHLFCRRRCEPHFFAPFRRIFWGEGIRQFCFELRGKYKIVAGMPLASARRFLAQLYGNYINVKFFKTGMPHAYKLCVNQSKQ